MVALILMTTRMAAGQVMDRLGIEPRTERGAVTVEYGVLIVGLALGLLAVVIVLREAIGAWFADIAAQFPLTEAPSD